MMPYSLPALPGPFAEAAINQPVPPGDGLVGLESLLLPASLSRALDNLLRRWGPGDRRAAASLWTQGYFARFLRPVLAYGLVHDLWFATALRDVQAGLSDMAIPVRFVLKPSAPDTVESHVRNLIDGNVTPLITRLASATGTSERVHWSNASFSFCRARAQVRALWPADGPPSDVARRLEALEAMMGADHPLFRLTQAVPDGAGGEYLQRRVCCIRYKLDGLRKCGGACPIDAPASRRQ